jgi:hypothetical protein
MTAEPRAALTLGDRPPKPPERPTLTVDKQWFISTMQVLIGYLEADRKLALRRGSRGRAAVLSYAVETRRQGLDALDERD